MQAKSNFNSTSPNGQLNKLSDAIDSIFARLDEIEAEAIETRRIILSCYSDGDLAQLVADESGGFGDRQMAHWLMLELERRCANG